jgi:molybdopterin synthase sulfur carrier subunit
LLKRFDALKISIRFFTSLREIVGTREETLEFTKTEKVTVNNVLQTLAQQHGKAFVDYVYDAKSERVKGFLQFLVNGQSTATLSGLETKLEDGDVLAIIPPVGGG